MKREPMKVDRMIHQIHLAIHALTSIDQMPSWAKLEFFKHVFTYYLLYIYIVHWVFGFQKF
jgi:hypothetical protein